MANPVIRWGILSTANIAREKLIPALKKSAKNSGLNQLVAIASRSDANATAQAQALGIPRAFGCYEDLINCSDIDAIYNPLPNHLHVPWTIKAIEAGKHVLCEKPIGLNVADAKALQDVSKQHPQIHVMEAFMYRFHPQWARAKALLAEGAIGQVTHADAVFTYFNRDPDNVRNKPGIGGGGILDIGCYCISAVRYLLDREPESVAASIARDPGFQTDKHASGLLDFGDIRASFFCSTQSEPSQRVLVTGETGSLLLEYPFYQPDECAATVTIFHDRKPEVITFEPCDHYERQVDAFAQAVLNKQPVPTPLTDALNNMRVIDAVFEAGEQKRWITL